MAKKTPEEARNPRALLPLTPAVFHIMLALAGGESHGYGIMLEVERLTSGQLNLGPGTFVPVDPENASRWPDRGDEGLPRIRRG